MAQTTPQMRSRHDGGRREAAMACGWRRGASMARARTVGSNCDSPGGCRLPVQEATSRECWRRRRLARNHWTVRQFWSVRDVGGLLLDPKMDWNFKLGPNILTGFVVSRAGPNWTNFSEIRSIRAESQNLRPMPMPGNPIYLPKGGKSIELPIFEIRASISSE